jgi:hypothetical protein
MTYRIDLQLPTVALVPCTFVPSSVAGKTLCVNVDGSSLVVEPNGAQVRTVAAGAENWDSLWTQAIVHGDLLVYQSPNGTDPGIPRAYRMVL